MVCCWIFLPCPVTAAHRGQNKVCKVGISEWTDTLMQGGGEQALIEISLDKKIPVLSSNKTGIEQGSTFGIVAVFYVLGQMSGEM